MVVEKECFVTENLLYQTVYCVPYLCSNFWAKFIFLLINRYIAHCWYKIYSFEQSQYEKIVFQFLCLTGYQHYWVILSLKPFL